MRRLILLFFLLLASCGMNSSRPIFSIGIDPSWYPLDLMGKEAHITGYTKELIQEINKLELISIQLIERNSTSLMFDLKRGQYQGILSTMQPYPFLVQDFDFSIPFLQTGPVLIVRANMNVKSMADMQDKVVALPQGTSSAAIMDKYPQITIRFYDSVPTVLADISNLSIDGALVDNLTASTYCSDLYQGKLKIVGSPLSEEGFRLITLHNKAEELQMIFDRGIKSLEQNGSLQRLQKKWLSSSP